MTYQFYIEYTYSEKWTLILLSFSFLQLFFLLFVCVSELCCDGAGADADAGAGAGTGAIVSA